jgi:hypothetical protein
MPEPERPLVPSCDVTEGMLNDWGFPVEVLGHVCGSKVVLREGTTFEKALYAAWCAGHVRLAYRAFVPRPPPKADPEMIEWARSIRQPQSPARRRTTE